MKREPAVIVGILASVVLAVASTLASNGVIGASLGDTIALALDPTGGWAIPIIIGLVTRFFVISPATGEALKAEVPAGYVRGPVEEVDIGAAPAE